MVDLNITRLIKRESGDPTFETIDDEADVVKLAGLDAPLDIVAQYGIDPARDAALDSVTRLAIGAGFDALRDAWYSHWSCATRQQPWAPACPSTGDCPTRYATTPA